MAYNWIIVHWVDIVGVDEPWITEEEAKALQPAQMITAGWQIHETPEYLVLASTLEDAEEPQLGNVNCIPKGCIKGVEKAKAAEAAPEAL